VSEAGLDVGDAKGGPRGLPWRALGKPRPPCRGHGLSAMSGDSAEPGQALSVDEYGAPVTFEAARWLVCFVPGLRAQFWHRFVHRTHKHVLLLTPNPDGTWTLFETWWTRLLVRTISTEQAVRFLRWAAMGDVLLVEEDVPGRCNQFRGWANCASLASLVLGRPYWVWSPHALFKRLRSEAQTRTIDAAAFIDRHLAGQPVEARAAMFDDDPRAAASMAGTGLVPPSGKRRR
jgi:hypothetical protein